MSLQLPLTKPPDDRLVEPPSHADSVWISGRAFENPATDGNGRTSPVGVFPANGYSLFSTIGNVWERAAGWYPARHTADAAKACCIPEGPRGALKLTVATGAIHRHAFRERPLRVGRIRARQGIVVDIPVFLRNPGIALALNAVARQPGARCTRKPAAFGYTIRPHAMRGRSIRV